VALASQHCVMRVCALMARCCDRVRFMLYRDEEILGVLKDE
jgi:hypothetical protein